MRNTIEKINITMNKFISLLFFFTLVSCTWEKPSYSVVDLRNDEVLVDEANIEVDSLGSYLAKKIQAYDSISKSKHVVRILVDDKTTTGTVVDVKVQLRNVGLLKLVYLTEDDHKSQIFN